MFVQLSSEAGLPEMTVKLQSSAIFNFYNFSPFKLEVYDH